MSEIYSIIAEKDRPYEWAYEEMTTYFKSPEKYWVVGLERLASKPNVHISIFHRGGDFPDIWRVYWSDSDAVRYDILSNYEQLKAAHPEIVAMLEANGVAAYSMEMERRKRFESLYGRKAPYYAPLSPIKVVKSV